MELDVKELEFRLVYAIIVAGKNAKFARNVVDRLFGKFKVLSPFAVVRIWRLPHIVEKKLREARTGNYKKITRALIELAFADIDLRTCGPEELEKIYGIGPKTARFFIMWSRPNVRYAVLDTHILKWLRLKGYNVPKVTPSGKKYKEVEQIFLNEADEMEMTPQELDTTIWKTFSKEINWSPNNKVSYLA